MPVLLLNRFVNFLAQVVQNFAGASWLHDVFQMAWTGQINRDIHVSLAQDEMSAEQRDLRAALLRGRYE